MKIIEELTDMIDEELADAEKYAKCAIDKKETYPSLGQVFNILAQEELKHANMLHDEAVKIINEYKASGQEVPAGMQAVYDYLHRKRIDKTNTIRVYIEQFKS